MFYIFLGDRETNSNKRNLIHCIMCPVFIFSSLHIYVYVFGIRNNIDLFLAIIIKKSKWQTQYKSIINVSSHIGLGTHTQCKKVFNYYDVFIKS